MKKNILYFAYYTAIIMPLMTLYFYSVRKEFSGAMVMFQGLWLILTVEGALAVNEKTEEKSHGYDFLRILPIKDREIVLSKFLIVLCTTIFLVVFNYILYLFIPGSVHMYTIGRVVVLLCALYALVLAGVSYIIIFQFGHSAFVKFVWAAMIISMVGPIIIYENIILKTDTDLATITEKLGQFFWLFWIVIPLCGLAVYYFLFHTAIRAKQTARG
ncbi:MAG: ABC-2 transporter permease [Candidatus Aminicenantes bacterium]|nr:MAG: ABC-2 transporter permease [Candidatus Aminicenantes bacterium]